MDAVDPNDSRRPNAARGLALVASSALLAIAPWMPLRRAALDTPPSESAPNDMLSVALRAALEFVVRDLAGAAAFLAACVATVVAGRARGPSGALASQLAILGLAYAASSMSFALPPGGHVNVYAAMMFRISIPMALHGTFALGVVVFTVARARSRK